MWLTFCQIITTNLSYIESKHIPQDLYTIIGRFLPYETIKLLSSIKNSSFQKDSQVYKEFVHSSYPAILKHYRVDDYKTTLDKIQQHDNFIDYACVEGLTPLLEDEIPSTTAMHRAFRNSHIETIKYLHEKHFKPYGDDKFYQKELGRQYAWHTVLICVCSMLCTVFLFATFLYWSHGYNFEPDDFDSLGKVFFELAPMIGGFSMTIFICTCLIYQLWTKPWLYSLP
jgi:hypothetical protein